MTVKDLIEELEKVTDKNMRVYFDDSDFSLIQITDISEIRGDGENHILLY